ncbi:hypothetical protein [Candidatus Nitrotoga arctica]|uniref:Uncharacterized protein n=1 Tax=Candidatus Nitrotoga arctica TaxID=453162 RepID=A0ABM8Z1T0_9PROT|nr:hypothetical protein [Candidatus Nitrotoga arctica]CAG9933795.1 conserved protein of unknown function [Candidatus Nitrotoga arctica]
MSIQGPLLTVQQGKDGTFVRWLEELGLKEFLQKHPFPKLVEWGWLVPQYRYSFPPEEFESDPESPVAYWPPLPRDDPLEQLWESDWYIKTIDEPLWFLHPFFRPTDAAGKILRNYGQPWDAISIPPTINQVNGETICPYVDYFFHWQGYALIDLIRASDCIPPILHTPDVKERMQGIVRNVERLGDWNPNSFLTAPQRWGGFAQSMTWISHYHAFRNALATWNLAHTRDPEVHKRGCIELASHLGVTAETLSTAIKNDFLRLAGQWIKTKDRKNVWVDSAWTCLQQDIYFAVEWLCYLTDKKIDYYLEKWSRPSHQQYDGTAELIDVLPFEFFSDRYYFLDMASHYLKPFNEFLAENEKLADSRLKNIVDNLRSVNYPFDGFLSSFRQLHDELTFKPEGSGKLDFRNRRPLDFYSLLAIRAEGCLMFALRKSGELEKITSLPQYISHFAAKRGLSQQAVQFFRDNKNLVQLRSQPKTPIREVMNLVLNTTPREQQLVRAFLCCVLARNYFAHHHYLDQELLRSKESAFMLGGIILTLLFLLE